MQDTLPRPTLWQQALSAGLLELQWQLARLDWSQPLTRAALRDQWAAFPDEIYRRLPAAKRFASPSAVACLLLERELLAPDALPEKWRVAAPPHRDHDSQ